MKTIRSKVVMLMVVMVILGVMLQGCAGTFQQNTYRTLYISGTTYDTTMKIVADLQKQGIIDQAKRDKINSVALIFYNAYQSCVNEFEKYIKNPVPTTEQKVISALNILSATWPEFAKLVNANKAGTMKSTLEQAVKEGK
jgi:hypothetical protein